VTGLLADAGRWITIPLFAVSRTAFKERLIVYQKSFMPRGGLRASEWSN